MLKIVIFGIFYVFAFSSIHLLSIEVQAQSAKNNRETFHCETKLDNTIFMEDFSIDQKEGAAWSNKRKYPAKFIDNSVEFERPSYGIVVNKFNFDRKSNRLKMIVDGGRRTMSLVFDCTPKTQN